MSIGIAFIIAATIAAVAAIAYQHARQSRLRAKREAAYEEQIGMLEKAADDQAKRAELRAQQRQEILDHVRQHGGAKAAGFAPGDDLYASGVKEDDTFLEPQKYAGVVGAKEAWDEWAHGGEGIGTNNPSRGVNPVTWRN